MHPPQKKQVHLRVKNNPLNTAPMNKGIKLIVGLGNPGAAYQNTRHNLGYVLTTALCQQQQQPLLFESKFQGATALLSFGSHTCRLLQPTTYMNHSGRAVAALLRFFKILPENTLIVHDDLDLLPGCLRLKFAGGHGGHNGLRDIISALATQHFYRLRIGIGHPGSKEAVSDFVLKNPTLAEKQKILTAIEKAFSILPDVIEGHFEKAMTKLHTQTL